MADSSSIISYRNVLPPTLFYFAVLFGLAPLFTQVMIAEVCHQKGYDDDDCDGSEVSSVASVYVAINSICLYLPTILTTGPYGAVANRYGRKPVLISGLVGIIVLVSGYMYIALVRTESFFAITASASLICGMSGGYSSFIMGIFSYAADTTSHNIALRKQSYPVTEACIFIPKLFCPVLTGIWAASYGFILPLLTGVIIGFMGLVWVLFIPESLPLDSDCRLAPMSLHPLSTFYNIAYLFKQEVTTGRSPIPFISVAFSMAFACYIGFGPVMLLYAKHKYNWGPDLIGYYEGIDGGISAFSMLCFPYIVKAVTKREHTLISYIQVGYLFR
jgi:MFS family permease